MADVGNTGLEAASADGAGERSPDPVLGERLMAALELAVELHRGLARKGTRIPYLGHILGAAALVFDAGARTLWYYRSLAEIFSRRCGGRLAEKLERTVAELKRLAASD